MKKNVFLWFFILMLSLGLGTANAQSGNAPCNQYSAWTSNAYSVTVANKTGLLGRDMWNNKSGIISNNNDTAATWTTFLAGSSWIEARNSGSAFPAGSYAGFVVGDLDLISLGASMSVDTYLNDTKQETVSYSKLIGTLFDGSKRKIGFVTTKPFNRIRLNVNAGLTLIFTARAYYAEVFKPCAGPELTCNTATNIQSPTYPALINYAKTGVSGINIGSVANVENVLDTDDNNYASLTNLASIIGSSYLSVKDGVTTYPSGTFAGFRIQNSTLASLSALNTVTIKTFLNGVQQEAKSGSSLLLDATILDFNNVRIFGFETTKSFNEVQIVVSQPLGISLGTTKVYNLVLMKLCEGTALPCNAQVGISRPQYPVSINSASTGVSGIVTALSSVANSENVIDNNPSNFATITLPVTAGTTGTLAVKKSLSDYPAGTYAGFDIQNVSLLNAQFLQNTTISTYKDGVFQESATGNSLLLGLGTDILANSGRSVLGLVTKKAFDEVRISINSLVALNLGTTKVYGVVVMNPCKKVINCNSSYYWNQPDFPVVLNVARTGIKSLACAACSVNSPDNIISGNQNDYSRITLAAGIGNEGTISVVDPTATYPKGTFVGFTVKDRYFIVQGDLLEFITVNTYLNGVLQESKTSGGLLDLTLLVPIFGTGTKNVGFYTTKPFDEVQISTKSLASIINILDVYGAFIDTRSSDGGSLSCLAALVANPDADTVKAGATGTVNVLANDTYNGTAATTSNVTLTQVSTSNAGVTLNSNTGLVTVAPGTPAGTYTVNYQICDKATPSNCKSSVMTVTVPVPAIDAVTETLTGISSPAGGTTTTSVLANDTVGGQPATTANVNLSAVNLPTGLTLNNDGTVTVAAGTPAGNYNVEYKICDKVNTNNCDTVISVVTVSAAAIVANNDTYTMSTTGGNTASVLVNDTLGGQPATTSNVNLTGVSVPSGLTLNSDGTITVAANTAPGTYNVTYQICDKVNTGNCSSVTSQVVVTGSADLTLKVSATKSVIVVGDDNPIYFTVKNIGNASTTGTTTITVNTASLLGGGTFSITTVPTGWTLVSQSGTTYVFSKNTAIAPGSSETFVFDYYTDSNLLKANSFSGTVQNAGDTNTSNNSDSVVLQIRAS
ncbi:hypothetical protein [Chryseobacterium sp.]|uniref:hypothetical protein n=1 Tax=Chryseobacterium sp. TaxID=1871047 RepID=UPI002899F71D|nr:hypothetical protein [Chryseobacterium sp.]